jgi:hypothetical protein
MKDKLFKKDYQNKLQELKKKYNLKNRNTIKDDVRKAF